MCEEVTISRGLSKKRTGRLLGSCFLALGIFWIVLCAVLAYADGFAEETVGMAAARYESFTGKIALNSFEEDKLLKQKILFAKETLLPLLSASVPVSAVLGVVSILASLVLLFFPVRAASALVKLRLFREYSGDERKEDFPRISRKVLYGILIAVGAVVAIAFGVLLTDPSRKTPEKVAQLEREASRFYRLEKAYFAKTKKLGSWKQIGYEPESSDYFVFKTSGSGLWVAENSEPWEDCPAWNSWRIGFEISGIFTKELKAFVRLPKDSFCKSLTPEFRKSVLKAGKF